MNKQPLTREEIHQAIMIQSRRCGKQSNIALEIALLAPYFNSEPLEGLDPTFYHTLSYEGDMEQYERLLSLVRRE